jgi:hypothetical protein
LHIHEIGNASAGLDKEIKIENLSYETKNGTQFSFSESLMWEFCNAWEWIDTGHDVSDPERLAKDSIPKIIGELISIVDPYPFNPTKYYKEGKGLIE